VSIFFRGHSHMLLLDPTFLFVSGCLLTPVLLLCLEQPDDLHSQLKAYFTDPALLAGVGAFFLTLLCAAGVTGPCWTWERRIANWFLLNGAFIHITMDGLTGGYHMLPLMYEQYKKVDRRFETDELNSWLVTQLELFVMGPLCLLTYIAYRRQWTARWSLASCAATLQWAGAVVFAGVEWLADFPNTPVDRHFKFTPHHCLYFWFGYGANFLWVVIPPLIVLHAAVTASANPKAKTY
jgi:hypothetical protein